MGTIKRITTLAEMEAAKKLNTRFFAISEGELSGQGYAAAFVLAIARNGDFTICVSDQINRDVLKHYLKQTLDEMEKGGPIG